MKRIILFASALFLISIGIGCNYGQSNLGSSSENLFIKGISPWEGHYQNTDLEKNGNIIKENREVPDFEKIEVSSALDVILKEGSNPSIIVEADEKHMDNIITEVDGQTLNIYCKKIKKFRKIVITVTYVNPIDEILVSGASDVKNEGTLKANNLTLKASGASNLNLQIVSNNLKVSSSGASDIDLAGKSSESIIKCSGASDVNAYDLISNTVKCSVSGASDLTVKVNTMISGKVSGASDLKYASDNNNIKVNVEESGASDIKRIQ